MEKLSIAFLLFITLLCTSVQSQTEADNDTLKNDISIKLVTIGPGDELTSWWGHTAIIVEDLKTRKTHFYNFGLFSFEDDNFVTNFIMGRLVFWVGAWKTPNALAYYRELDRDIRFQILNLSREESMEIKKFLENNVLPENARYLYDHYYDNCSTRLRDIFNRTSNGKLEEISKKKSRFTLREHTRRHTHHNPIMDFLLMFLMNDSIDKEITVWDDMFLPTEMETVLDSLEYQSETGEIKNIVKSRLVYYESKTVSALPEKAPIHWPYTLILGIVFGVVAVWFVYMDNEKLFLFYNLFIGLVLGFIGSILFFLSTVTDHTVTYYNENLFFTNPLTLLIFPLAILVLKNRDKYLNIFYINWLVIVIIAIVGVIVKIFPAFDQGNLQTITLILPILLGNFISAHLLKNQN
jgi:uncharacterized membrane protein YeaQ/YmgE (transglycosylase-associated protein family)